MKARPRRKQSASLASAAILCRLPRGSAATSRRTAIALRSTSSFPRTPWPCRVPSGTAMLIPSSVLLATSASRHVTLQPPRVRPSAIPRSRLTRICKSAKCTENPKKRAVLGREGNLSELFLKRERSSRIKTYSVASGTIRFRLLCQNESDEEFLWGNSYFQGDCPSGRIPQGVGRVSHEASFFSLKCFDRK